MSACLFVLDVSKLSESELHELIHRYIKVLAIEPASGNRFEEDQWCGRYTTLIAACNRVVELEDKRYNPK